MAILVGSALVVAVLLATGLFSDLFPTEPLSALLSPSPSCLDFAVTAEGTIPDAMRHNWRSSRLDWVQIAAKNRCPEVVSFDVTLNVERAFPVGREGESVGIPCRGAPCEFPQTIPVPACTSRPEQSDSECATLGAVLEQLDPWLEWNFSSWDQERPLSLEFSVHVVENGTRARAGGLFDFLFNDGGERGETFPVAVELRPRTTYLWEWDLVNNPRPEGNPREAALASLAVWAITGLEDRLYIAKKWPVDDSLDNWMNRVYDELLSGFRVRTGADQLPPLDGDVVIALPETVLAEKRGSPIEIALLVAALANSAITVEDRNDHIIVMMAPKNDERSETDVFVAWVNAEYPEELKAFSPTAVGFQEFTLAVEEATSDLDALPIARILAEVTCAGCDGVYVDTEDQRIAAVHVIRATSHYGLTTGLPGVRPSDPWMIRSTIE